MRRRKPPADPVVSCPYCRGPAHLVGGHVIYPRRPDLATKAFWYCPPCKAWVGCHPGTHNPLGRLADAELRTAKMNAHSAFDQLWRRKMKREGCSKSKARKAGYAWLAEQLGMDRERCHIGMMDVPDCLRVVEVCRPFAR